MNSGKVVKIIEISTGPKFKFHVIEFYEGKALF